MKLFKVINTIFDKRIKIRDTYKAGIGEAFILLRYILPIIFLITSLCLIEILSIDKNNLIDLIRQLNSLIGIILGFSIASFAIFISIANKKLDTQSNKTEHTYREIGSSLFFYNVEVSLFTSLIGIILLYVELPIVNITYLLTMIQNNFFILNNLKILLFLTYLIMFFQLILNLFYSSIYLDSSVKAK